MNYFYLQRVSFVLFASFLALSPFALTSHLIYHNSVCNYSEESVIFVIIFCVKYCIKAGPPLARSFQDGKRKYKENLEKWQMWRASKNNNIYRVRKGGANSWVWRRKRNISHLFFCMKPETFVDRNRNFFFGHNNFPHKEESSRKKRGIHLKNEYYCEVPL